jgi:hypothetical protein
MISKRETEEDDEENERQRKLKTITDFLANF